MKRRSDEVAARRSLMAIASTEAPSPCQDDADLGRLFLRAHGAQREVERLAAEVAAALGARAEEPGVKSAARARAKVATELEGDASLLLDLARSAIVCDGFSTLYGAWRHLTSEAEVVRVRNRFARPRANSYRDLNVIVRLPTSGLLAEVQLHLSGIAALARGDERSLYLEIQAIERARRVDEATSSAQLASLRARSRALYEAAWQQHLLRAAG